MDSKLKILRAKTRLILDHPFFGNLCSGLVFMEDKSCKGMWTDGKYCGFNPFYVESLHFDELTGLMGHIVLHRGLLHHKRMKTRDKILWNAACDYSVNWILLESGFKLPKEILVREDLKNLDAEKIYEILLREKNEKEEKGKGENSDKGNSETNETDESSYDNLSFSENNENNEKEDGKEMEEDENSDSSENESNADNMPQFTGEVREPENNDKNDNNDHDDYFDIHLKELLNSSLREGSVPDSLKRMVQKFLNPKLDWKNLLERFLNTSAKSDYTWIPPNRRFVHSGLYLPSMKSNSIEDIVLVMDTSGSITEGELEIFISELGGALTAFEGEIVVMGCDAQVNYAEKFKTSELPLRFPFAGGGGTDFRPPFKWADENLSNIRCLVYFTDLNSSRYPDKPDYPVLWVTNNDNIFKKPPFGEIININY
ncbi:MAG: VWA-like domain-containing protein [Desulforegulaceae bacterium]|nr:VWA-like domain-containing protein [Desulforegulaceae bacterium]